MTATLDDNVADLRRVNAELQQKLDERTRERDEALEQQTATAEVLQVINSSPGELAPVFDAMLEKTLSLCDAVYGHVYTYDGERVHPVAIRGEADFIDWLEKLGPYLPGPGSPMERTIRGERIVHVADALQEEAYRTAPGFKKLIDASGIRTGVTVGLRKEDMLLGAINIYRKEVRPFSEKQIALLENFAAQAVIAIENARLITETREALEQQTATAEVLQVINASPGDLAPVFDAMLDKAIRLSEATHSHLFTYDGDLFHLAAARGEPRYIEWQRQAGPVQPYPSSSLGMHFVASGAEALDRLAEELQPALVAVLSDINMPGMDGLELLGEIKQRRPDLPVMMVTAYGDDERRRRARELGAFEFITKPLDFDQLKEQLRQLPTAAD